MRNNEIVSARKFLTSFNYFDGVFDTQRDVYEFNFEITDMLEKKFDQVHNLKRVFQNNFEGEQVNIVKCTNIDYTSKKIDKFSWIHLDVKGQNDIK